MVKSFIINRLLFVLIFLCPLLWGAKQPQITPMDVKSKMEEILKIHVSYKELNPALMARTLENFIEELDPTKTYLLDSEVAAFLNPSEKVLQRALLGFKTADFSLFEEIHSQMVKAIERRNKLEEQLVGAELPKGVKNEEFREISWAKDETCLYERLLRVKALQKDAFEKLEEPQDRLEKRIAKRRLNHESELMGSTGEERQKQILSMVLKASTAALDAHTNYFTPREANQFMIQVQQRLFGIGAQLRDDLDGLSVVRILEKSPASRGNLLKINDKIIAVDKEPIMGLDITEAVELIRGPEETAVQLTLLRDTEMGQEKLDIELVRSEVVIEESRLESSVEPYGDGAIAVLKLFSFYQDRNSSSASDMRHALEEVQKDRKLKGVLLDLRSNAGGLLTQAVSVSGLFMHKGIVVSIKDDSGKVQHLRKTEGDPVFEGPLVVLVNRASASAAEIVAQALQDYGRAVVVGDDHTFGKGTFQTFTLDAMDNSAVNPQGEYKVTRGKYYTVSGKSPQLKGVKADIVIPGILAELDIGEEFGKFPLTNDSIEPHFDDDLSDISPFHRIRLGPVYKADLQRKVATYEPYLDLLKKNSSGRIAASRAYQEFLAQMKKKNYDALSVDLFGQADLQMAEAVNVIKDLIFLLSENLSQ